MKIKFSELKSPKGQSKKVSYDVDLKDFYFDGEKIKSSEKIVLLGEATYKDEIIILNANLKGNLELICSRCLDTFIYPIDIDIEERFTSNETLEDEEVILVNSDVIDITEIVEKAIISTLPIKRLCKEDCKGLCQSCGANLNKEECSCNNEDIDLRLADLKALLNNKEV
ncbi:MAG: YceD family protein [Clostridium sp.]